MIDYFKWIGPLILLIAAALMQTSCSPNPNINIHETSQSDHKLSLLKETKPLGVPYNISLYLNQKFQTTSGFSGAFREASAQLLNRLSTSKGTEILRAYFDLEAASHSMARTHMNSCDFSLKDYSYSPVDGDKNLEYFSIDEDREHLIPIIKDALKISYEGFTVKTYQFALLNIEKTINKSPQAVQTFLISN